MSSACRHSHLRLFQFLLVFQEVKFMPLSNPFFFLLNIHWGNVNVKGSLLKNIFVIYIYKQGLYSVPSYFDANANKYIIMIWFRLQRLKEIWTQKKKKQKIKTENVSRSWRYLGVSQLRFTCGLPRSWYPMTGNTDTVSAIDKTATLCFTPRLK